jgi:hypothetical protein
MIVACMATQGNPGERPGSVIILGKSEPGGYLAIYCGTCGGFTKNRYRVWDEETRSLTPKLEVPAPAVTRRLYIS